MRQLALTCLEVVVPRYMLALLTLMDLLVVRIGQAQLVDGGGRRVGKAEQVLPAFEADGVWATPACRLRIELAVSRAAEASLFIEVLAQ